MSARAEHMPRSLVAGVLVLTLVVLGLGGAVLAVKLRPQATPRTPLDRQLQQWRDAVGSEPNSDTAHTGLGLALLNAGDRDAARGEFETAIELNAKNWMAPFQLGLLLRETDRSRAIHLLGRASRLAPPTERSAPLIAEGDLLLESGDAASAKRAYQRAIGDAPFIIEAHLGLAKALEALGDRPGALEEYRRAAEFDPSDQTIADAIVRLTQGDDR
jgi:tetratricopeptide (TPR) repeat protein